MIPFIGVDGLLGLPKAMCSGTDCCLRRLAAPTIDSILASLVYLKSFYALESTIPFLILILLSFLKSLSGSLGLLYSCIFHEEVITPAFSWSFLSALPKVKPSGGRCLVAGLALPTSSLTKRVFLLLIIFSIYFNCCYESYYILF